MLRVQLYMRNQLEKIMQTVVQWKNCIFCNLLSTTQDRIVSIVFYKLQPRGFRSVVRLISTMFLVFTLALHNQKLLTCDDAKLFDLLPVAGNRA